MLKEKLLDDLKNSMKEKNVIRKNVIQMVRAAILQVEKDKQIEVSDDQIVEIIAKEAKKRKDSIVDDAKEITSKFMDNYKEKRSEKMPYISYGVAIYDPKIAQLNYETIEDAIKEADKEMYEYKRAYKKRKSLS